MGKSKLKPSWVWPHKIVVDKDADGNNIYINTGPYNKSIVGETQDDVNKYLVHLQERYLQEKMLFIQKMMELNKETNGTT